MKWRLILVCVLAAALCSGCTSTVKKVDVNKGLDSYYGQRRSVDLLTVRGTNMTITYTGVTEYKVASILPPLNVLPREPGLLEKLVDGAVGLGKWGIGWYFGSQIMTTALEQPRTVTGGLLTMLAQSGAGTLAGNAHMETFRQIARGDAAMLSEVFQRQFDAPLLAEFFPGEPALAYFEFAPAATDESSRVVEDALKLAKAGVLVDPEELSEKTGYRLERVGSE